MPQSTLQRAVCLFITRTPPHTHTEAARVERGPGREGMAGPRLAMLPSQLGEVYSHSPSLLEPWLAQSSVLLIIKLFFLL